MIATGVVQVLNPLQAKLHSTPKLTFCLVGLGSPKEAEDLEEVFVHSVYGSPAVLLCEHIKEGVLLASPPSTNHVIWSDVSLCQSAFHHCNISAIKRKV